MQISGYTASQLQSFSDILKIPMSELIQGMIAAYVDTLENEQIFKLLGVSSEEEADQVYAELITPVIMSANNPATKRFRIWYDDREAPYAWVVDALKAEDLYNHPFVGRWNFSEYNTIVGVLGKAIELGVKPEEIHLVQ